MKKFAFLLPATVPADCLQKIPTCVECCVAIGSCEDCCNNVVRMVEIRQELWEKLPEFFLTSNHFERRIMIYVIPQVSSCPSQPLNQCTISKFMSST
jgi:hypothetical protein